METNALVLYEAGLLSSPTRLEGMETCEHQLRMRKLLLSPTRLEGMETASPILLQTEPSRVSDPP